MRVLKNSAVALVSALFVAGCGSGNSSLPQPGGPGGGGGGGGGGPGPVGDSIFMEIVPPGSTGNDSLANGGIGAPSPLPVLTYPNNYRDQLDLYGDLSYAKVGLKADTCNPPASIDDHEPASDQACNYFKDAGFEPKTTVSTLELDAPEGGKVTIRRDGWGVPYVDGDNRAAAEYGMGYAAAQDRLWLFDLLRYVGRGKASQVLGPVSTTYDLDLQFGGAGGYSDEELTDLVNAAVTKIRANQSADQTNLGSLFLSDVQNFVDGMNAYVASAYSLPNLLSRPPEYATLALDLVNPTVFPHAPFTVEDIVANAVLIQAQFGRGGGGEASNVALLQALDPTITGGTTVIPAAACNMWRDLRHANDPERANTLTNPSGHQSPETVDETCPQTLPPGAAIWDVGSLHGRPLLRTGSNLLSLPVVGPVTTVLGSIPSPFPPATFPGKRAAAETEVVPTPFKSAGSGQMLRASADPTEAMHAALNQMGLPKTSSNWIGVNADQTKDGHPIIVAGPQTGYFEPQLLWEVSVMSHGNTPFEIAAHGITTVNLPYVVIGHGLDFGWSATSAESDLIDTRVSRMCNTDGSPVGGDAEHNFDADGDGFPDADGYIFKGQCVRFYKRLDQWVANPTPASMALGCTGSLGPLDPNCHLVGEDVTRFILRTHYGPVTATATVQGAPVAISEQRSTFFGDVDTTAPFALLTTTGLKMNHQIFKQLFNSTTSTFNWIYADSHDLAYIQSGLYPIRHPQAHPELPVWGDGNYEWAADQNLPASFFQTYGGDGNDGAKSFPSRAVPVAQGDPLKGYFEWPGYLSLTDHIQTTNPEIGYLANWNNAGAPGWWAADSNGTFGATHRQRMLAARLQSFKQSGRQHDVGTMIESMADAAYTDLRGQAVLGLLLDVLSCEHRDASGCTQGAITDPALPDLPDAVSLDQVIQMMRAWRETGSNNWISNLPGLGSYRRDRNQDGKYDFRPQVVLMDAWYPHLIDTMLPQLTAIEEAGAGVLQGRYDAPRGQGSAYQEGWFEHMKRVLETALGSTDPDHTDYRVIRCANSTSYEACRTAVLQALSLALVDLGGLGNQANWDGSQLTYQKGSGCGTVEACDAVVHTSFSLIPVPDMPWLNRPTFQQVTQVKQDRDGNP